MVDGIADLRPARRAQREQPEELAWSQHWSDRHQHSWSQRFFSFYRKVVFARSVRYFLNSYFPRRGVFVETGSGTSETSIRIDKCGGARTLVAVDLVLPVLRKCASIMDVRVCGDIFRLPFRDCSLDGIWNVGVMEHYLHDQIDEIMREFHRTLRPRGRIILLWPAITSVPQRLLRLAELLINFGGRQERFQFHPDEVSQLRSDREGRQVLERNGFRPLHVDRGLRNLLAFKTLIGVKL